MVFSANENLLRVDQNIMIDLMGSKSENTKDSSVAVAHSGMHYLQPQMLFISIEITIIMQ